MSFEDYDGDNDPMASLAEDTRELVFAFALQLAKRVINHVDEHELSFGILADSLESADCCWEVQAGYGHKHAFVRVTGTMTEANATEATSLLSMFSGGPRSISFGAQLPRTWVDLAAKGSERIR